MPRILRALMVLPLLIALATAPVFAQETARPSNPLQSPESMDVNRSSPPGELILADVIVTRPLGIVACAVGLVGSFLTLPFAASSNSGKVVGKELIEKPFAYTFTRPVGEVEY